MLRINAARLIAAIIESGRTERDICAEVGVGQQTLKKMKAGSMVRLPSIRRICETLNLTPADVIEDSETLKKHESLPQKANRDIGADRFDGRFYVIAVDRETVDRLLGKL